MVWNSQPKNTITNISATLWWFTVHAFQNANMSYMHKDWFLQRCCLCVSQPASSIIKPHTTVMRPVDRCAWTHWHTALFLHTLLKFYTAEPESSGSLQPSVCGSRRPLGFLATCCSRFWRHTSVQNTKLHSKSTHHWDMKWIFIAKYVSQLY